MTTDLYELLGLTRSAKLHQIRAAYRCLAKAAHPDAGGDEATFAQLKLAHDVLCDPDRRRRYDATGEHEENRADNADGIILSQISHALALVMVDLGKAGQAPPYRVNVAEMLRRKLDEMAREKEQEIAQNRTNVATLAEMMVRWTVPEGKRNVVQLIVRGQMAQLDQHVQRSERTLLHIRAAEEMVRDAGFALEQIQQIQQVYVGFNVWTQNSTATV